MIKKKGKKSKPAAKKAAAKKKSSSKGKKEKDTAEVRRELVKMVKDNAHEMVEAVIGEGKKGQVSPVKYLLEEAIFFLCRRRRKSRRVRTRNAWRKPCWTGWGFRRLR